MNKEDLNIIKFIHNELIRRHIITLFKIKYVRFFRLKLFLFALIFMLEKECKRRLNVFKRFARRMLYKDLLFVNEIKKVLRRAGNESLAKFYGNITFNYIKNEFDKL